jgi:hypothetical protein
LKAGDVTQVVEHLPSKSKVLSSNPSTAKNRKEERKEGRKKERIELIYILKNA